MAHLNPPAEAHVWTEPDADYVDRFQQHVNAVQSLQGGCPTARRLLRCGHLQFALGNYAWAHTRSTQALQLDARNQEAMWLRAMSALALAGVRLGLLPLGPGSLPLELTRVASDDVEEARRALAVYLRQNGRRDEEACALLDLLSCLAAARASPEDIRRALEPVLRQA